MLPIQSIERAAAILRLLSGRTRRLGVASSRASSGCPRARCTGSCARSATSVSSSRTRTRGKYQLGAALLHMGSELPRWQRVADPRAELVRLARRPQRRERPDRDAARGPRARRPSRVPARTTAARRSRSARCCPRTRRAIGKALLAANHYVSAELADGRAGALHAGDRHRPGPAARASSARSASAAGPPTSRSSSGRGLARGGDQRPARRGRRGDRHLRPRRAADAGRRAAQPTRSVRPRGGTRGVARPRSDSVVRTRQAVTASTHIASVDQGTASSRCLIFDARRASCRVSQKEHRNIYPRPGWVEHDPSEIWRNVLRGRRRTRSRSAQLQPSRPRRARDHQPARDDGAVGPRDRRAGAQRDHLAGHAHRPPRARARRRRGAGPLPRALRAPAGDVLLGPEDPLAARQRRRACASGPRPATCCSGRSTRGCIWNLTGAPRHRRRRTPSRTMLMNLASLDWDDELLDAMGVPRAMLPEIRPSTEVYGEAARRARAACRSRRRSATSSAALFGQTCFDAGRRQVHVRHRQLPADEHGRPSRSPPSHGLLTTVGYKIGDAARDLRARGLDRRHRRARAVAPRQPRADRAARRRSRRSRARSRTTAAATSCRRSRACSRRTGESTRAA